MWALDALGLGEDADERAVKRAYALRVKTTRPEENAAAFQKLHETYQAALSYLRHREDEDEEDEDEEDEVEAASPQAQVIGDADPPPPDDPALQPTRPAPYIEAPPEEEPEFRLDVGAFVQAMRERAAAETPEGFAEWLRQATADWPLGARPAIAPHILPALVDPTTAPTLAHFDAIARTFGFDDVRAPVNPLWFQQAREGASERETAWRQPRCEARLAEIADRAERVSYLKGMWQEAASPEFKLWLRRALFVELFKPDARELLYQRVAAADFTRSQVNRYARRLVQPGAALRARLMRPLPSVPGDMLRFLTALDGGKLEALSPAIDAQVVTLWSENATGKMWSRFRIAWFVLIAVAGLGRVLLNVGNPPRGYVTPAPAITLEGTEALLRQGRFSETVIACDQLLEQFDADASEEGQRTVAIALWRKADALGQSGDVTAMSQTVDAIVRKFGSSSDYETRHAVAQSLFIEAYDFAGAKDYVRAVKAYEDLGRRFEATGDSRFAWVRPVAHLKKADVLDDMGQAQESLREYEAFLAGGPPQATLEDMRWLATAMTVKGFLLEETGRISDAVAAWDAVEARFANHDDFEIMTKVAQSLISKAAYLRADKSVSLYDLVISRYSAQTDSKLRSSVANCYLYKARDLANAHRDREAAETLEKAIALYSDDNDVDISRAVAEARTTLAKIKAGLDSGESSTASGPKP